MGFFMALAPPGRLESAAGGSVLMKSENLLNPAT